LEDPLLSLQTGVQLTIKITSYIFLLCYEGVCCVCVCVCVCVRERERERERERKREIEKRKRERSKHKLRS
jgi:hypothetical protein